jgi:hypothetical protein
MPSFIRGGVSGLILAIATSINSTAIAETLPNLLRQAVSTNSTESQAAIAALRQLKDEGVQAFWTTYQAQLPKDERLRHVLDRICQQKDCDASRLYWYTDLAQAKVAAKASNRPILSLRLLGHLDEDLSCANSRFSAPFSTPTLRYRSICAIALFSIGNLSAPYPRSP